MLDAKLDLRRLNRNQKRAINKRRLSVLFVEKVRPQARAFLVWDSDQKGLALQVQPTGYRAFKFIYRFRDRPRWFHIGAADAIGLADARKKAAELMLEVLNGKDPAGEKRRVASPQHSPCWSAAISRYAKRKNKSWRQADHLVRRWVLPLWADLDACTITRADVRAMLGKINGPILANQVLASASAIFTWAGKQEILTHNPCRGLERHATASRERVLSDARSAVVLAGVL